MKQTESSSAICLNSARMVLDMREVIATFPPCLSIFLSERIRLSALSVIVCNVLLILEQLQPKGSPILLAAASAGLPMLPAVLFSVSEASLYSSRRWKGYKMALIGERRILKIDGLFISGRRREWVESHRRRGCYVLCIWKH